MNWKDYKKEIEKKGELGENCYILGIDLGTTNTILSYMTKNTKEPVVVDVSGGFGRIPMPSVVQYREEDDEWVIGEEAYRTMLLYPETTVRSAKRHMGTGVKFKISKKELSPEVISSKILIKLINHIHELNPNAEIAGVVISVPYDFDDNAKKATIHAAEIAGLKDNLICLIEEPKAAALALTRHQDINEGENILIFDFGGGTLDLTIFKVIEKTEMGISLKVISQGGASEHGGDIMDEVILKRFYEMIEQKTSITWEQIALENRLDLSQKSKDAKERLSKVKTHKVPFTFLPTPFMESIKREEFNLLIEPFIEKTRRIVEKTLIEAYPGAMLASDINRVVLEGGSCEMPWVREMLLTMFHSDTLYSSSSPALDISIGATYYAAIKMGFLNLPDLNLNIDFDVTVPHDIGIELLKGGKPTFFKMIPRGTSYSLAKKSHNFKVSSGTKETLQIKILERLNKEDKLEDCVLIDTMSIENIEKNKIGLTLSVEEENGTVKGEIVACI
ncbi:MAG: Hsp70 family protein [Defluviitaleaceae bacterium]|nr:Hsp70 family protein [Defluviitaleaceae bacterium]